MGKRKSSVPITDTLKRLLKKDREEAGLTSREAADKTGYNVTTIRNIERGTNNRVGSPTLTALALLYGKDVNRYFKATEDKKEKRNEEPAVETVVTSTHTDPDISINNDFDVTPIVAAVLMMKEGTTVKQAVTTARGIVSVCKQTKGVSSL